MIMTYFLKIISKLFRLKKINYLREIKKTMENIDFH